MKKIFWLYLLFVSIETSGQSDTTQIKFIEPPDSTAIGTPDGKLVSKEIGPSGGTIVSEDGRVELIFPVDALTANTTISIQPTINLAPNGTGKAYQFEPSGIQFKKPVQIIFHYTDEDAKTCPPDLMGFAMQDHTGKWSFFDYDDWDSTAKILKGSIEHFSGAAPHVSELKLVPGKRTIMVNEETSLSIANMFDKFKSKQKILSTSFRWYVNGAEGGNSSMGTIEDINIETKSSNYKAPSMMPDPNPVTIAVEIFIGSEKNKSKLYKGTCDIEIYDGYEIKIDGSWNSFFGSDDPDDPFEYKVTETSSFTLEIETLTADPVPHWKLIGEPRNDPTVVNVLKCPNKCKCAFDLTHCTGMIEIVGIKEIKVVNKIVTVFFDKAEASFPTLKIPCKGLSRAMQFVPRTQAVPSNVVFALTGENQARNFDFGGDIFPIKYTYTIKRMKKQPDIKKAVQ